MNFMLWIVDIIWCCYTSWVYVKILSKSNRFARKIVDSEWIREKNCEFLLSSLSLSRINFEVFLFFTIHFTFFFANSLWISYLLRRLHSNSLSFFANSLSLSSVVFKFTIFFANSFRIHFFFRECTIIFVNSQCCSRVHFEFTIFFDKRLSMNYLFRKFTVSFANSLSCFANLLWK